jgi:hypothetical protein
MGMKYDDMVVRNSRAIGIAENQYGYINVLQGADNDDMWYAFAALSLTDTNMKKAISFFNKQYKTRREELRQFSLQDEIEDILDTLSDECIVYDEKNFFAHESMLSGDVTDEIKKDLSSSFKSIYHYFNFHDGETAWTFFRKWLIEGFLAFEIIYDKDQKNIIGFKELDPIYLVPGIEKGTNKKIWVQFKGDGAKERTLYDSQIIYLAYASSNIASRVSYLERLIRSFNLLRIMEHTRIIWAVTNASFKMKFIIPVGGKSKTRAKQSLAQLMHNYREIVDFNYESGELTTNGKPMMQFNKEYWLPSKEGETPEIEAMGGEGPELNDTEQLKYFSDKMKMASKIPFNRFDSDSPAGFEIAAEGMLREEIKFAKFVNRLRSKFQEILVKPLYIQIILKHPELAEDEDFRCNVSIRFNKENMFDLMKDMEIVEKQASFIQTVRDGLSEKDSDMNEVPFFDLEFLIKRFMPNISEDDLELNEKYKKISQLVKDGYSKDDAKKIADGEPKSKFKIIKKAAAEDDGLGLGDSSGDSSGDSGSGKDSASDGLDGLNF